MSSDSVHEIKRVADDIQRRYEEEEFDIDATKASGIMISEYKTHAVTGEIIEGSDTKLPRESLAIAFSNAISTYQWRKTDPDPAKMLASARALVLTYNAVRTHECLRDGRATKRRLADKDGAINSLQAQLQDVTKKLGVMEDRLRQCSDEKIELENIVKEQKERIDNTRAGDIKHSFGSEESETEGGEGN